MFSHDRQFRRRKSPITLSRIIPVTILITVLILIGSEEDADTDYISSSQNSSPNSQYNVQQQSSTISQRRGRRTYHLIRHNADPYDTTLDAGDCPIYDEQDIQVMKRPRWYKRADIRRLLPSFAKIYMQNPTRKLDPTTATPYDLRFDHSFALWYILRVLKPRPSTLIELESGTGLSTWMIRHALPFTKIYSFNENIQQSQVKIGNVRKFLMTQFSTFNWLTRQKFSQKNIEETIFFLNDYHASDYYRIFDQLVTKGFKKFIIARNYPSKSLPTNVADSAQSATETPYLSLKFLCQQKNNPDYEKQIQLLKHKLVYYYEFPPIATSEIIGQAVYEVNETSTPFISDPFLFQKLTAPVDNITEFHQYAHITYLEVR